MLQEKVRKGIERFHDMIKRKYLGIVLGAMILAFGIYNIHSRCNISEGGVLGMALLAQYWLNISPGVGNFVMDVVALIAGTILLKQNFLKDSILASASFFVFYRFLEHFEPLFPDLSGMPAVAAILGGCFVGVGTSLIVRQGCAAGADDTLALIANRKLNIKLSSFYFVSDFAVLLMSMTYIAPTKIVWSFLSVIVSSGLIAVLSPEPKYQV